MAGSVCKVVLIGRLGRDPEKKTFPSGGGVVTFGLATSTSWKDKASGERKETTTWHNVCIHNEKLGEIAERYLKKGSCVYLEGTIQNRKYKDKEGNEKQVTEIVLPKFGGELTLLDSKAEGAGGGSRGEDRPAERKQPAMSEEDAPW